MKLLFVNMIMLLLVSMAALSCSKEPMSEIPIEEDTYTIVISGTASDKESSTPLEGIKIGLHAAEPINDGYGEIRTMTVYTDNRGYFTLTAGGFTRPISCTVTAEDTNNIYGFAQQNLNISWSGPSFDMHTNYFYVNDCDFYLERMLK